MISSIFESMEITQLPLFLSGRPEQRSIIVPVRTSQKKIDSWIYMSMKIIEE